MPPLSSNLAPAQPCVRPLPLSEVAATVAEFYRVGTIELLGPSRRKSLATARKVAYLLCRKWGRETYSEVGRFFGRSDVAVLKGVAAARRRICDDVELAAQVEFLEGELAARAATWGRRKQDAV